MDLTHFNEEGRAHMVEVSQEDTKRTAIARGRIKMKSETINRIKAGLIEKGDVLSVARRSYNGCQKTSDLIPCATTYS